MLLLDPQQTLLKPSEDPTVSQTHANIYGTVILSRAGRGCTPVLWEAEAGG